MNLENLSIIEYTSPGPEVVQSDMLVEDVIATMKKLGVRHIPVLNGSSIVGIISHRDFGFRAYESFEMGMKAEQIMTPQPYIVGVNTPLIDVAFTMSKNKIGSAIVINEDQSLYGIFTTTDALNALIEVLRGEVETDQ